MITLIAGKYTGKTLEEVWDSDPRYLLFLAENVNSSKYPVSQIKEFLAPRLKDFLEKENILKEKRKIIYKPICDTIKGVMIKRGLNNRGVNFFSNMLKRLEEGELVSDNASSILCDSLAKSKGRRNSNIYKETLNRFVSIMEEAVKFSYEDKQQFQDT